MQNFVRLSAESLIHSDTQINPVYSTDIDVPIDVTEGNNHH